MTESISSAFVQPLMGDSLASIRNGRTIPEVAQEFEALLLAYMLKTMRQSVESGGLFPKESGHETYMEMMDHQLARSLASKQSLGIADLLESQIGRKNGSPVETPAATESPYRPVSDMGWRRDPINGEQRYHKGVDLAAPEGTPVPSLGSGKVVFSGWRQGSPAGMGIRSSLKTPKARASATLTLRRHWSKPARRWLPTRFWVGWARQEERPGPTCI